MDSEVTFQEEPEIIPVSAAPAKKQSSITNMAISFGLAKNEKEAQILLLVITIVGAALAVVITIAANRSTTHNPSAAQIELYAQEMVHISPSPN